MRSGPRRPQVAQSDEVIHRGRTGDVPVHKLDTAMKDLIEDALKATRSNRGKAAMLLQSTERIISYKVKKFRIDSSRYRNS